MQILFGILKITGALVESKMFDKTNAGDGFMCGDIYFYRNTRTPFAHDVEYLSASFVRRRKNAVHASLFL